LRVSPGVIYRALEDGVIPVIDFGPDRRPLRILARWLDEQLTPDFERYPPLSASSNAGEAMAAVAKIGWRDKQAEWRPQFK